MANVMASEAAKRFIASCPALCGGFLLLLLVTFIAVANRERVKKETCYFCCRCSTQDINFRKLDLESFYYLLLVFLEMHAPPNLLGTPCF